MKTPLSTRRGSLLILVPGMEVVVVLVGVAMSLMS